MHYEYLAIFSPPDWIYSDVMIMKYQCKVDYNWDWVIKSKPHITLSNFIQPFSFDKIIINRYRRLAASASPFKIYLSGFGHFSTHTIFIKLMDNEKLWEMSENVKSFTKAVFKKIPNFPPHNMSEPHLTIAKGISETEFCKIWPTWEKRKYYAEFEVNRIQLLRRPFSAIKQNYEVVNFPLTGLGILNPQLKMF
jgi:2'-5' RNA ligase